MVHASAVGRTLALAATIVGVAGEVAAVVASPPGPPRWNEAAVGAVVVAYAAVGVLIVWHRPANPVGRIAVLTVAGWGPADALVAASANALRSDPADRAGALGMAVGATLAGLAWLVLVLVLPLVFPDGTAARTRTRVVARIVAAVAVSCFSLVNLLSPNLSRLEFAGIDNPIGLPQSMTGLIDALGGLTLLLGAASLGLATACLVQLYRAGGPLDRQQTMIFGLAFLPPLVIFVATFAGAAPSWAFGLSTLPLPIAIGVSVLQRRLYDVPLAVNRAITYGTLTVLIALLYALVVGGVGAMLQQEGARWLPWVAAGVVAVAFAPLRTAMHQLANRLTYGQWAEPRAVVSRIGERLTDAGDLDVLLGSLVTELAVGLTLGYVAITDPGGRVLACSGPTVDDCDRMLLSAYGLTEGELRWARRVLRDQDRELLAELAGRLGSLLHTRGLVTSLRAAQERLVLAREEERRRLRRDLHDGLGPALAALTLQVDTVRNLIAQHEPAASDAALLRLRTGVQDTVLDVRRIVEGLRPPALDDLGLVEGVRRLADLSPVPATMRADLLPRLPAAVEVAAYRVVQEALTNAARHAGAGHVDVSLTLADGRLLVQVDDDGSGELGLRPDGVGMGSMRERAEEIGGSFAVQPVIGRGTRVSVLLPLAGGAGHAA